MNKKGDYEVISSRQDIGTTHGLSARTWMEKKMYRLIFKSVIDAMAHYNTLKQALRSRGYFLIFDKEVAV
jgi:hypothetical protein